MTKMNDVLVDDEHLVKILNDLFDVEEYGYAASVSLAYPCQEDAVCSVCLDRMAGGLIFLACGHRFHSKCIELWLEERKNCPYCRQMVSS